jgi:hypothetical protein
VLPSLERATGRSVRGAIVRTAANVRGDLDELRAATVEAWREVADERLDGDVRFDAAGLRALHPALAGRVIRMSVYNTLATDWAAPWSKDAIESVLDLAMGRPGRRRDLPDGRVARRDRTHVIVSRAGRYARG